tara:strand:+ start:5621 stop:6976 length:1356 start_codon:yes stop_codon:yes gene_type:complete
MSIVVQQDAVTEAISSIPDLIFKARQLKSQENQQAINNQIALDTLELKKSEAAYNKDRQARIDGTNAGGFENNDIGEYFNNISMVPGRLSSEGGALSWQGNDNDIIPDAATALEDYKQIVANSGNSYNANSDMKIFGQYYNGAIATRHSKNRNQIKKMLDAGFAEADIADAIAANPTWHSNIQTIIDNDYSPENEMTTFYAPYLPTQPTTGVTGDMSIPGAALAGTTAYTVGKGLYDYGQVTPDDVIQKAKESFSEKRTASRDALDKARDKFNRARTEKTRASAKALMDEAKAKYTKVSREGAKELKKTIRDGKRWNKLTSGQWSKQLKSLGNFRAFAPMLLGDFAGFAGQMVSGDKGEAISKGVVGGGLGLHQVTANTLSIARNTGLGQFVAKELVKKMPLMAKTMGIASMADGPVPIGDIVGLAMSGYLGIEAVTDAIAIWNKANRINQ